MLALLCNVSVVSGTLIPTTAAALEAVFENALGIQIKLNARYLRSLMQTSLYMHDHIVHFYHLHGLDWVDVVSALSADPAKAAQVALQYTDKPIAAGEGDLRAVQERVKGFVETGKLGPLPTLIGVMAPISLLQSKTFIALISPSLKRLKYNVLRRKCWPSLAVNLHIHNPLLVV